jgi:peptidoglycan-N-acetylglucosamine deacetylase
MHTSWFRKPVHKIVSVLTILFILGCILTAWFSISIWPVFLIGALLSSGILIGSSFIIRSGLYITTINSGNANQNKIAITFDDGPCEQSKDILKILDQYQVKASFFLIGSKIEGFQETVKAINEKHHNIGNHSFYHHNLFPLKSPENMLDEIIQTQQLIKSVTGNEPAYFRPPFGITNPLVAKALNRTSLKTIGWSIRSLDTVTDDPKKIIARIKKRLKPGSIILLHDTTINVIPVLEELLVTCTELKLKPVSLDEFLMV